MYNQGIHARSGVACADCHMPYQREGSQKISDHHVRSPLLNINQRLPDLPQVAGRGAEGARRDACQERVFELRNRAMDALMSLIADTKAARDKGATEAAARSGARLSAPAQFLLDFVEAENSIGFHAPEEAERLLAISIDYARQGQIALLRAGAPARRRRRCRRRSPRQVTGRAPSRRRPVTRQGTRGAPLPASKHVVEAQHLLDVHEPERSSRNVPVTTRPPSTCPTNAFTDQIGVTARSAEASIDVPSTRDPFEERPEYPNAVPSSSVAPLPMYQRSAA